ncbi:hypothetical protein CK216_15740 [Mesorhizobium sp. WSM3876]|nr:hypothetical protein CK216_15740 [Mesorhizobium sp. WSM3876]
MKNCLLRVVAPCIVSRQRRAQTVFSERFGPTSIKGLQTVDVVAEIARAAELSWDNLQEGAYRPCVWK